MSFLIKGSAGLIDTSLGKTPMLCSFISEHRADILAWSLRELKDRYPNREDDELINGLSTFIDELVGALRRDSGIPPPRAARSVHRSEERRVGKECRYRWWGDDDRKRRDQCIRARCDLS